MVRSFIIWKGRSSLFDGSLSFEKIAVIQFVFLRDSDSEEYNKRSYQVYKECLSNDDLHYLISKSNYGIFLKMVGKFDEAITVLLEVVNNMSNHLCYFSFLVLILVSGDLLHSLFFYRCRGVE